MKCSPMYPGADMTIPEPRKGFIRKRAIIRLSDRLILELLKVPDGHTLVGLEFDAREGNIELFLEGGNCPECREGNLPRCVTAKELR